MLNQLLAIGVSVNDKVKADEKDLNINKGSSLLHICAQFCNNVAGPCWFAEKWPTKLYSNVEHPLRTHIITETTLLLVIRFQAQVAVSFLIQQRADLKAVCNIGSNPLHRAAMGNNAVGVKLLVQAPISVRCCHAVVSLLCNLSDPNEDLTASGKYEKMPWFSRLPVFLFSFWMIP